MQKSSFLCARDVLRRGSLIIAISAVVFEFGRSSHRNLNYAQATVPGWINVETLRSTDVPKATGATVATFSGTCSEITRELSRGLAPTEIQGREYTASTHMWRRSEIRWSGCRRGEVKSQGAFQKFEAKSRTLAAKPVSIRGGS
jgi:hypothetical protein